MQGIRRDPQSRDPVDAGWDGDAPSFYDGAAVERLLEPEALLGRLAEAFVDLSSGKVVAPQRIQLSAEKGFSLSMPAYRPGGPFTVKVVNVFEGNRSLGLPSHQAVVCLFDEDTGRCTAVLDGAAITAARTAAAAALSARLLAREDAAVLTIVGAGVQARAHLRLMPLVRRLAEIRVVSRSPERAARLAALDPTATVVESTEDAVRGADIVALCTNAGTAAIDPGWVGPGAHVTSVGYRAPDGELPRALAEGARLFVETRLAFEPPPAGAFELGGLDPSTGIELGEVLQGSRPGRTSPGEVTVYKAMGHAVEDLVAAELVVRARLDAPGPLC
jgi:ornithine cyclodeaminase/thiomorpholine-carboxylate dehydrogenase